jgi:hypothetical protein
MRSASSLNRPDELLAELELLLRIDSDERRGEREVGGAVDERVAVEDDRRRRGRRALLALRASALTVVMIGPVPVQRASTEAVCNPPRLSRTLANVPLTLVFLRSGSNCVGAARTKPQLKVPSGHWPPNPTLRGGLGSGVVPASMKLSVSTIRL